MKTLSQRLRAVAEARHARDEALLKDVDEFSGAVIEDPTHPPDAAERRRALEVLRLRISLAQETPDQAAQAQQALDVVRVFLGTVAPLGEHDPHMPRDVMLGLVLGWAKTSLATIYDVLEFIRPHVLVPAAVDKWYDDALFAHGCELGEIVDLLCLSQGPGAPLVRNGGRQHGRPDAAVPAGDAGGSRGLL